MAPALTQLLAPAPSALVDCNVQTHKKHPSNKHTRLSIFLQAYKTKRQNTNKVKTQAYTHAKHITQTLTQMSRLIHQTSTPASPLPFISTTGALVQYKEYQSTQFFALLYVQVNA